MSAQLVNLAQYRSSDVVETLRDLLAIAERGEMSGIVFVCKLGAHDHRAGRAGDYKRHPEQALSVTFVLKHYLSERVTRQVDAVESIM